MDLSHIDAHPRRYADWADFRGSPLQSSALPPALSYHLLLISLPATDREPAPTVLLSACDPPSRQSESSALGFRRRQRASATCRHCHFRHYSALSVFPHSPALINAREPDTSFWANYRSPTGINGEHLNIEHWIPPMNLSMWGSP